MDRRELLAAAASAAVAPWSAGCLGGRAPTDRDPPGQAGASGPPTEAISDGGQQTGGPGNATDLARRGRPPSICDQPIQEGFTIRAIVAPAFADGWGRTTIPSRYGRGAGELVRGLGRRAPVIGVAESGSARAYPLAVVAEHEVVNDRFQGPLLVTYCPRCQSGMTARRLVNGAPTTFHVSGNLWQISGSEPNLVLYDAATRSFWTQLAAMAICGPEAGTTLALRPSSFATWGDWVDAHPETDLLLPPPTSRTDAPREARPDAPGAGTP